MLLLHQKLRPSLVHQVSRYRPGQTMILYFMDSQQQLSLDYLRKFDMLMANSQSYCALVTQEGNKTPFPPLLRKFNIICDNLSLSRRLPNQQIPNVAIFDSRGKLQHVIFPGNLRIRGVLQYQPVGFRENQLSTLIAEIEAEFADQRHNAGIMLMKQQG